ncbi:MAG: uroporphyrinogen decarboxylase [Anaerolineaceae bacterium]|nr:uroporphyrinogen decarboxylase [Anaerolineaceae bacterium]
MNLSHRERIERTIQGAQVDRPAVSLWRHFPVDDQSPETLARSVLNFQKRFDFDFVKITSASSYCLLDWGVKDEWRGNPEGTRQYVHQPVQTAEDWQKIQLFPMKGSKLFEQLRAFELVRKNTPDTTPVLPTIFSPLSQAKNLVGKENLVAHLRQSPDQVLGALQVITDLTLEFIQLLKTIHVDGIFFAVQQAQYSLLTREEFQKFGAAFDLQILDAAKDFWFNLGHLHGTHVMFDELSQYPVQVLNWHDLETYPGLDEGKKLFPRGAVCGGLQQWQTLAYGTPESVKAESRRAIERTQGKRFILGTGCVTPIIAPDANLFAAREVVEEYLG